MVYMVCYFLAGAAGSFGGTLLWEYFGWPGVCGLGSALPVMGTIYFQTRTPGKGQTERERHSPRTGLWPYR